MMARFSLAVSLRNSITLPGRVSSASSQMALSILTFAPVTMTCPQFPFSSSGCGVAAEPVVDPDGKIIIAGDFIAVNGVSRTCVARLNANGTLDQTFIPSGFTPYGFNSGTPFPIRGIAIQSDGKIVIGGRFSGGNCGPGTAGAAEHRWQPG